MAISLHEVGNKGVSTNNANTLLLGDSHYEPTDNDNTDQQLYNFQKQQRQNTIKNNIILVTVCNILCVAGNT